VSLKTLNYIGDLPDKKYFNKLNDEDYKLLNENYNGLWNLKEETLTYLSRDLNSLMEVIDIFNKQIYIFLTLAPREYLEESKLPLFIKGSLIN